MNRTLKPADALNSAHQLTPISSINVETYVPQTLRSEFRQRAPLPVQECLDIGLALASALQHLHRNRLVHRDLKLSNVVFVHGRPKLADIGLVAGTGETNSIVGTDGYIPPEGPGTVQADLYGLGKILYEMATGNDRNDFPALPARIAEHPNSEEFSELNAVILKACEAEARARYQSTEELLKDLMALKAGKSVRRRRLVEQRLATAKRMATVALVAGPASSWWLYSHHKRNRERLERNLELQRIQRMARETELKLNQQLGETMNQLAFQQVEALFENGHGAAAVAQLARIVRQNPTNHLAAERLMSALTYRNFALLAAKPLEHEACVGFAEFSPEGNRVVTASWDHTARIWDVRTAQPITPPLQHEAKVRIAQFSPDGDRIITVSADFTARVWDVQTGQPLTTPLKHGDAVRFAEFSPDGLRVVTASVDHTVRVWDAHTGQMLAKPLRHDHAVCSARFSPDGQWLITASEDKTARIWDLRPGEALVEPFRHGIEVLSAEFSLDGERIVTVSDDAVRIWNVRAGQIVAEPIRHEAKVTFAQFSPDGRKVVTVSDDRTARVWNSLTGRAITGPLEHARAISTAQFSPDGLRIVTASADRTAQIWNAATGERLIEPIRHGREVWSAQFSWDGKRVLTASSDKTACVWDARTGQLLMEPFQHEDRVNFAEFSPDGRLVVTASDDKTARVWDVRTGQMLIEPLRHYAKVNSARFSPNGRKIVTASHDASARVWELLNVRLPIPEWLPDLAEAVDGQRINAQNIVEPVPGDAVVKAKKLVAHGPVAYTSWAEWFLADRSTRAISPSVSLNRQEFVRNRIRENNWGSLREAVRLSPTNAMALAQLASVLVFRPHLQLTPQGLGEALRYSRRALERDPFDLVIWFIRVNILQHIGKSEAAFD